jgi:hypothetical protein
MMLRATAKLLTLLRPTSLAVADGRPEDWYANLLWLNSGKCVLFTHAGTLFAIFVPTSAPPSSDPSARGSPPRSAATSPPKDSRPTCSAHSTPPRYSWRRLRADIS